MTIAAAAEPIINILLDRTGRLLLDPATTVHTGSVAEFGNRTGISNKLALLCLGDADAALHLPGSPVTVWDYLALAIGLPALGHGICRLDDNTDLTQLRPVAFDRGWIAGPPKIRTMLRTALQS